MYIFLYTLAEYTVLNNEDKNIVLSSYKCSNNCNLVIESGKVEIDDFDMAAFYRT